MSILMCLAGMKNDNIQAAFVGKIANALNAEVTLLYVKPEMYYGHKRVKALKEIKSDQQIAQMFNDAESILKKQGVEKINTIVRGGGVVEEIVREAEKGYTMVATGTRGLKLASEFLLDSVSKDVSTYVDIPVLVVKKDVMPKRILVCTDGSEYAVEAEYCAGYLAKKFNASMTLLSVVPVEELGPYAESSIKKAEELLKEEFGIQPEVKIESGDIVNKILDEAKACDLLVLGSRGLSRIKKLLMGHVSLSVLNQTETNVIMLRRCVIYSQRKSPVS